MKLAHDQEGRATQSDTIVAFIRATPPYQIVGAGEEVYGRLVLLHPLADTSDWRAGQAVGKENCIK